jgi:hypothetical protein
MEGEAHHEVEVVVCHKMEEKVMDEMEGEVCHEMVMDEV